MAGGGTALASMTGASQTSAKPAATVDHSKATFLLGGVTKEPIAVDLTGQDLDTAKGQLVKAKLKLGTVAKVNTPNCKPATVVELTPHPEDRGQRRHGECEALRGLIRPVVG